MPANNKNLTLTLESIKSELAFIGLEPSGTGSVITVVPIAEGFESNARLLAVFLFLVCLAGLPKELRVIFQSVSHSELYQFLRIKTFKINSGIDV